MSNPTGYNIQLYDNNGVLVDYIDDKVSKLSWDWDRIGGCGRCSFTLQEDYDGVVAGSLQEDYEVQAWVDGTLFYSGYVDKVSPKVSGIGENISVACLGYVNQLKRIIVKDRTYTSWELSAVAEDVLDNYVTANTAITSTSSDYDVTDFSADSLYFNENAHDVISKLSEIAGKREWGVRADKSFFFKRRDDAIQSYYHLGEDFTSFKPIKDFNPIRTVLYLEGADNYNAKFLVTNKVTTREVVIQNSSIKTQSVGQQYARAWLKEKGAVKRSYVAKRINVNDHVESTIPIGKSAVNMKIGINALYDDGVTLYDSTAKYDGGTEAFQISKIRYDLTDTGFNQTLYFGPVPPTIVDEFKRLEFEILNERNTT